MMWLNLQIFGFRALWSPYYFTFVCLLALAYFLITGPYRHKFGGGEKPSKKEKWFFYSAMALLYIVKGSPVDLLTHITLTAHMIQMAVYYLIFPLFIIKGIPVWLWRKLVFKPKVKPVVKFLSFPLISILLFNMLFSLYHLPAIFDLTKSSQTAHVIVGTILLVTAFIVWWPLVSPFEEFDRMSPVLKIGYIFANGVLITPACVLIIFANVPFYAAYSQNGAWIQSLALCVPSNVLSGITGQLSGPQMFTSMGTLEDQQLGGIIMKVMQEATYGTVMARIFFKWFKIDAYKIDPVPDDIQQNEV